MSRGPDVFLSYRRADSMTHALLLARTLEQRASARVFVDVDSIPPGVEFRDYVAEHIASSDAMIVMIGDQWLETLGEDGTRRIDHADDQVRLEVRSAIEREMPLFPVLVEGARMPRADELPSDLEPLAWRNAVELRESDWDRCVDRLADGLPGDRVGGADRDTLVVRDAMEFPARFTDRWFAEQVGALDETSYSALLSELKRRNWEDWEIEKRVAIHRAGAGEQESIAAPVEEPIKVSAAEDDPIGGKTFELAEALMAFERELGRGPRERDMADALGRLLGSARVERKLDVPAWDPQPGAVDVWTADWLGRPQLVVETKLKDGNDIYECIWDLVKVLCLGELKSVEGAYLVVGSTVRSWEKPVAFAEFFSDQSYPLVERIAANPVWWEWCLEGGRARPLEMPEIVAADVVGVSRLWLEGREWELRAVRVLPEGSWLPCRNGWPLSIER